MVILANMWNKWASVASLTNAAKLVGVTPEGLSVQFMQQDKFEQAAGFMEIEEEPSTGMSTLSYHHWSTPASAPIFPNQFVFIV